MPLMQQATAQPAQAGFFPTASQSILSQGQAPAPSSPGKLSFDPNEVEQQLRSTMSPAQLDALDKFLKAGTEMIFGKDSHYKLMDGIEKSKDLGGTVGNGAALVADMLIKNAKGLEKDEESQGALIPAGTILIADVGQFLNELGLGFTDEDYTEALHVFDTLFRNKYDPTFKKNTQQSQQPQAEPVNPEESQGIPAPSPLPQAALPMGLGQGSGLLNQTQPTLH